MSLKLDVTFDSLTKQVEVTGDCDQLAQLSTLIKNVKSNDKILILPRSNELFATYSLINHFVITVTNSTVLKIIVVDSILEIYIDNYWRNWLSGIIDGLVSASMSRGTQLHQHIEAFEDDKKFLYHISSESWHLIITSSP